jgi:hypothetical protein
VSITDIVRGTTSTLSLPNGAINVDLATPYVAFWSAVAGLGSAAIGGLAGGLIPDDVSAISRRQVPGCS